ncbi:MAG: ParB/RepB/Spo0J family partition protein [Chloroflexota bacterium]|nr:ParB/RepB/Spo0J family partition protein [Chloroflexota bacterium]
MTPAKGRRALGRGLDALLPPGEATGLRQVEITRIEPNPDQPRRRFERKALEDLAASVKEHGVVQPLVVSAIGDDRYRIVVGERRWQAAKLAGLDLVPVVVKDTSDRQTLELALVENVQRADLNPLEEATAYQRLIQDFGLTQQQVAQQVGRSRVAIANTLRLLVLPATIQQAVVEERITEGHARALLALPSQAAQSTLLERIERDELSVRRTEELVKRLQEGRRPAGRQAKSPDITAIEDELRRSLGTRVSVQHSKRGGKIVIEYYSDEEFQGLYDRLLDLP